MHPSIIHEPSTFATDCKLRSTSWGTARASIALRSIGMHLPRLLWNREDVDGIGRFPVERRFGFLLCEATKSDTKYPGADRLLGTHNE